jgi:hypothetical protein
MAKAHMAFDIKDMFVHHMFWYNKCID